jgi:hypothetical protein
MADASVVAMTVKKLEVSLDATYGEDALHVVGCRDQEHALLLCPGRGARVEQDVQAAGVQEREPAEIEDELAGSAVECDLDLRPGRRLAGAVEAHDGTRALRLGRRQELRRRERDHDHTVLLAIARDPRARMRDIADIVGITERAAHRGLSGRSGIRLA